jgi:hypothetical protein
LIVPRGAGTLERWTTNRAYTGSRCSAIMGALADLSVDVRTILRYIEGDDDDEATPEDLPDA